MNSLEIKKLNVHLGEFSLKDIDMTIPQGTVMGLVGRNGAGKTTLIKSVINMIDADSGAIYYNGKNHYDNEEEVNSMIGMVLDRPIIGEALKPKKIAKLCKAVFPVFDEEFYFDGLKKFNIPLNKRIMKLSFGMKKKAELVFALSRKPSILVLDEPTAGIDPADRLNILDMLRDYLAENEKASVLFSTHITSDLDKIADYVTLIDDGKVVFSKTKDSLEEAYLLFNIDASAATDDIIKNAIGVHKTSFGYEGLTDDKTLLTNPHAKCKVPTIEEIMVCFTQREENK